MIAPLDVDRRLLNAGVPIEVCAHELAVKRPVVFGVAGGVDSYIAAASGDVPLESRLLRFVENVPAREREDHDLIVLEVCIRERATVFRRVHGKLVILPEPLYRVDRCRNRVVPKAGGLTEKQDTI